METLKSLTEVWTIKRLMKRIALLIYLTLPMTLISPIYADEQINSPEQLTTAIENTGETEIVEINTSENDAENSLSSKSENETKESPKNVSEGKQQEKEEQTGQTENRIENEADAWHAIYSSNLSTDYCGFLRRIEDSKENKYYIFTQGENGIIKVVTAPNGDMLGIVYHIIPVSNDMHHDFIRASQAEYIVQDETGKEPIEGTTKIKLSTLNQDGEIESKPVWVVYTDDHTAHYVSMDGTYLYALPVKASGDAASLSGNDSLYIFDRLNSETQVSSDIQLMKDSDNQLYLCDLKHKLLMADYNRYIHDGSLISVEDTGELDEDVKLLEKYAQALDYFDSVDLSPVLILKNAVDRENASDSEYIGHANGWHIFAMNDYADDIPYDVACCVNEKLTGRNDVNDVEKTICEIESDICRHLSSGKAIESKPVMKSYFQKVLMNDSDKLKDVLSELNRAGMTLEELKDFFFAVHVSYAPESDLNSLLPWVMENLGTSKYTNSIQKALS